MHHEVVEKLDDESNLEKPESESLRLFLESDDEQIESTKSTENICDNIFTDDPDIFHNSQNQKDECISKKNDCNLFSKLKMNTAIAKFAGRVDLSILEAKIASVGSPKLCKKSFCFDNVRKDDFLVFDDVDNNALKIGKKNAGLDELKNRFVKHVKCKNTVAVTKPVEMTIVQKETDSQGM